VTDEQSYREDAATLAEIGDALFAARLPAVRVRLPKELADRAVAAWQRDDGDAVGDETPEQAANRHRAGTLALIGLTIEQCGELVGDVVVVDLDPVFVGLAVDAADGPDLMERGAWRRYAPVESMDRAVAEERLRGGDPLQVVEALLSVALHDPDWRWAEATCLRYSDDPDLGVRAAVLLCFSHLARLHRDLDLAEVAPVLRRGLADEALRGRAQDVADDLRVFLGEETVRRAGLAGREI
jgi:hypothetical protein